MVGIEYAWCGSNLKKVLVNLCHLFVKVHFDDVGRKQESHRISHKLFLVFSFFFYLIFVFFIVCLLFIYLYLKMWYSHSLAMQVATFCFEMDHKIGLYLSERKSIALRLCAWSCGSI